VITTIIAAIIFLALACGITVIIPLLMIGVVLFIIGTALSILLGGITGK